MHQRPLLQTVQLWELRVNGLNWAVHVLSANASTTACFTEDEMVADSAVMLRVIKCS